MLYFNMYSFLCDIHSTLCTDGVIFMFTINMMVIEIMYYVMSEKKVGVRSIWALCTF